jgi:hypothetical protein
MIAVTCINQNGETYQRGILAVSLNTITEHEEHTVTKPRSWIKFWDGAKAVNVVVAHSVHDIARMKFVATHGKKFVNV